MKRAILVIAAVLVAALLGAGSASSNPAWAGVCGMPAQQTVWADYAWPSLLPILARPGTLLAVSNQAGTDWAAEARSLGATTYAFDLKLRGKVGTPLAPADPSSLAAAAQAEYQVAVDRSGGCATPLVVENELSGGSAVTPWSAPTAQYRANVLAYLQDLAAVGAHPVLLVPTRPFLGSSDAVDWWLQVAQVADIVREDYAPAPLVWKRGVIQGNRMLRQQYRQAAEDFLSIGIPASRVGIMISVLSQTGVGGRDGLEPAAAWYQVAKWFALSAKETAAELHLGSVYSWGWQQWNSKEADPDKANAACVWLWARNRSLCDAPHKLGRKFDSSLVEGQLTTLHSSFCHVPGFGSFGNGEVTRLATVTGDRNAAVAALFERIVERHSAAVPPAQVLAVERAIVAQSFGGSWLAWTAALAQAHTTPLLARAVLGDEIRQARIAARLPVKSPATAQIEAFRAAYPQLLVRQVRAKTSIPWLGNRKSGLAIQGVAPQRVFTARGGVETRVTGLLGTYTVKMLGAAEQLGPLPVSAARPAIAEALSQYEQAAAFQRWTIGVQRRVVGTATCRLDAVPEPGELDLTQYLPFLRLQ